MGSVILCFVLTVFWLLVMLVADGNKEMVATIMSGVWSAAGAVCMAIRGRKDARD